MALKDLDLVGKLTEDEKRMGRFRLRSISPDEGKYGVRSEPLRNFLSAEAEWLRCARIQQVLLHTRREFDNKVTAKNIQEIDEAVNRIDPYNIALLEENKEVRHDQLAVLLELSRYVSKETAALLHPGTTSFDILDTARSSLFREAWQKVIRPKTASVINQFCELAEQTMDVVQVGRTHLQYTSPVTFGSYVSNFASRMAERVHVLDYSFNGLKGKISGITGTGAGIEMVAGKGKALQFEEQVLARMGLSPDLSATQIVQKEPLVDIGNGLVTMAYVLGNFAEDMRILYSTDIQEVTQRDNAQRLGGSSAAAGKNNPIDWENISGKIPIVESGMTILYRMLQTNFQRDLRNSVEARYQPQTMMAQVYEMFSRAGKVLPELSLNEDQIAMHLDRFRAFPDEPMNAILKGAGFVHSEYGDPHTFVKTVARVAKKERVPLLTAALKDPEFRAAYARLSEEKKEILGGRVELYLGDAKERGRLNIEYAREITSD